jgi:NAD(P)-dependent dehydrogenase (short-subunit alcohol dehydrogenase family)
VKGTFLVVQAVLPQMKKQSYGKIVCLGSIAGKVGGLISGPHYVASKGAIHAFIKWVAKDGAPYSIYVNGIAPGPIETEMTKGFPYSSEMVTLKRLGSVEDIAEAALFLSSQASNWITGMVMDVNGGMTMN